MLHCVDVKCSFTVKISLILFFLTKVIFLILFLLFLGNLNAENEI